MEAKVLTEGRALFSLDLHPAYSGNPLEGIRRLLEPRLLRWDDELDGVLLAYRNLRRLPAQAEIRPYFPYIQLKVVADVLIFRPTVGSVLCGRVTELGADFVGYTVLGALNGAIGRQSIRPQLSYSRQTGTWECEGNPEGEIRVGGDILFSVEGVRVSKDGVTAIRGSLQDPWSGACRAAAQTWPAAFGDPQRWQQTQPAGLAMPGISAAPLADPATGPATSPVLTFGPAGTSGAQPSSEAPVATKPEPWEADIPGTGPEGQPSSKKKRRTDPQFASPPSQTAAPAKSEPAEDGVLGVGSAGEPVSKKKKRAELQPSVQQPAAMVKEARTAEEAGGALDDAARRKKKKRKASLPTEGVEPQIKAESSATIPLPGKVNLDGDKQRSMKKRKLEQPPPPTPPALASTLQPWGSHPLANGTCTSGGAKPGVVEADPGDTHQRQHKEGKKSSSVDGGGRPVREAAVKKEDKGEIRPNGIAKVSEVEALGTLSKKQKKKAKRKALNGVAPS